MKNLSLGEKRMRINFSSQKPGNTYYIKRNAAEIINVLEAFKIDPRNNENIENARLIAIAQTEIEKAAEIAVKAVTDGSENEKDLISFGNFVLSEERDQYISQRENRGRVHHSDLANWKDSL
ncbi:hypothetical protein OK18_19230 [Chryseobacterium gallinarum]|uniref:Uncharacterized protein n=1 Tax=Chryseobacterium gallinarum TaxID=1324352 RepID=A0A0G3M6C7_CHRGL|nr:hypothetical protein [Chryseobacterium gallinarum]AKK74464.1 hypothetical protein OK18_19230 [Chryseobacterium gallinarum]